MQVSCPESLGRSFDAARKCVVEERRRTTDELHALETLVDELRSLPTESVSLETGRATVTARTRHAGSEASCIEAVRDAYEGTLMSVPHYDEEYDETYVQSVAEEFGPDLATALAERTALDDQLKAALVSAATEAQTTREALLTALDTESESLETARTRLRPVVEELAEFTGSPLADAEFETLDAYRARLAVLAERCDDLATRRQSTLLEQRHELWLPVDGPDVATYPYQPLDARYPVLAAVTAVAERVEETRTAVERAMGYCN